MFYIHPVHIGGKQELLHNHAMVFEKQPMPTNRSPVKDMTQKVVREGTCIDMCRMLDCSTVTEALIGVSYLHEFNLDPDGIPIDQPDELPVMTEVIKREMKYYKQD